MALDAKVVEYTANSGTGSQTLTGAGFTPKAAILILVDQTAIGDSVNATLSIGFSDGSVEGMETVIHTDAVRDVGGVGSNVDIGKIINDAGTVQAECSGMSFNSDGGTITWDTAGGSRKFFVLWLGGSSLTNAEVDNSIDTTDPLAITTAFQPDGLIIAAGPNQSTPAWNSADTRGAIGFGVGVDLLDEVGVGIRARDQNANDAGGWEEGLTAGEDGIISVADDTTGGSPEVSYDYSAKTATSYTLDRIQGSGCRINSLALKGMNISRGKIDQPTASPPQDTVVSGLGFEPTAVIFFGASNRTATDGEGWTSNATKIYIGFATGTTEEGAACMAGQHGTDNADTRSSNDRCITIILEGTPTVQADAELKSFDSDGFTITWQTTDAAARVVHFLALGPAPVAFGGALHNPIFRVKPRGYGHLREAA